MPKQANPKKQEVFIITSTEQVELNLYAVRNKEGKWFRAKGQSGYGKSWVDDINSAKIYTKPGPAKTQVTFWANAYPDYGVPDLIQISSGVINIIDQTMRVTKIINKKKEEKLRSQIISWEDNKKNYLNSFKPVGQPVQGKIDNWDALIQKGYDELRKITGNKN